MQAASQLISNSNRLTSFHSFEMRQYFEIVLNIWTWTNLNQIPPRSIQTKKSNMSVAYRIPPYNSNSNCFEWKCHEQNIPKYNDAIFGINERNPVYCYCWVNITLKSHITYRLPVCNNNSYDSFCRKFCLLNFFLFFSLESFE